MHCVTCSTPPAKKKKERHFKLTPAFNPNVMAESVDNSLTDRILRLVSKQDSLPEFPADAEDLPSDYEYDPDADEEIEEVEEISENDLLQYLESERSALSVAKQLFYPEQLENANQLQLQVLTPNDVHTLYNVGAIVIDNVVDPAIIRGE